MSVSSLEEGKLSVTRERMWGQYRRPKEIVLVKLPADPMSKAKYLAKGFTFIRYGGDEIPMAILDMSPDVLQRIAPIQAEAVIEPALETIVSTPTASETLPEIAPVNADEPELYVADHPYKSKRKAKNKKRRSTA
jgi:hypothetical protein